MSFASIARAAWCRHLACLALCLLMAAQWATVVHAADLAGHVGDEVCVTCLATAHHQAALTPDVATPGANSTHGFITAHCAPLPCREQCAWAAIRAPPLPSS